MPSEITTNLDESDARELARVKMTAFETGSSGRVRFPYKEHYDLIEKWATEVEVLEFKASPRQKIVAVVDTENGGAETKSRRVIAWAKWVVPTKVVAQTATTPQDPSVKEAEEELHRVLNHPDCLPPGTNLELMKAFRANLKEGKRKYYDEENDWCMYPPF